MLKLHDFCNRALSSVACPASPFILLNPVELSGSARQASNNATASDESRSLAPISQVRSEERPEGKECDSTWKSRCSQNHYNKNNEKKSYKKHKNTKKQK